METENSSESLSIQEDSAKTQGMIAYICLIVGLFTGALWLVGGLWAMVNKGKAAGTRFEDHYANMVSTFIWGLVLSVAAVLVIWLPIAWLLVLIFWLWLLYRTVKGLFRLAGNRSYND